MDVFLRNNGITTFQKHSFTLYLKVHLTQGFELSAEIYLWNDHSNKCRELNYRN